MPLITTIAGAAARAYGLLSSGIQYFLGYYAGGGSTIFRTILDNNKNVIFTGGLNSTSIIAKLSQTSQSLIWQKQAVNCVQIYGVGNDSTNNLYFVTTESSYGYMPIFVKIDTDGSIVWQKYLGGTGFSPARSTYSDAAGFCLVGNANADGLTVKYNSSGTLQWQRIIDSSLYNIILNKIATDSSGNVYSAGYYYGGDGQYYGLLLKYNSSGTLQWQKSVPPADGSGTSAPIWSVTCDLDDNIYAIYENGLLIKYDTTGAILWQKRLPASNPLLGLAIDSQNNVYASDTVSIYKLNSSGTPQIKITLSNSGGLYNFAIDGQDYIMGAKSNGLIIKLPLDGSKTGTYTVPNLGSVTYSSTSFSTTATSVSPSNPGFSDVAGGGASITSTISMADLNNAYTYVNI